MLDLWDRDLCSKNPAEDKVLCSEIAQHWKSTPKESFQIRTLCRMALEEVHVHATAKAEDALRQGSGRRAGKPESLGHGECIFPFIIIRTVVHIVLGSGFHHCQ